MPRGNKWISFWFLLMKGRGVGLALAQHWFLNGPPVIILWKFYHLGYWNQIQVGITSIQGQFRSKLSSQKEGKKILGSLAWALRDLFPLRRIGISFLKDWGWVGWVGATLPPIVPLCKTAILFSTKERLLCEARQPKFLVWPCVLDYDGIWTGVVLQNWPFSK